MAIDRWQARTPDEFAAAAVDYSTGPRAPPRPRATSVVRDTQIGRPSASAASLNAPLTSIA
jgi:hypothetical protein